MWELIFLMVILKIPIVYLCWVVYWAIKAEPRPDEPQPVLVPVSDGGPNPPAVPGRRPPNRPPRPHGRPSRRYARTRRATAPTSRR